MKNIDTKIRVKNNGEIIFEGQFPDYLWEQYCHEPSLKNLSEFLNNNYGVLEDGVDSIKFNREGTGEWEITDIDPIRDAHAELINLLEIDIKQMKKVIELTERQVVIDVLREEIEEKKEEIATINRLLKRRKQ